MASRGWPDARAARLNRVVDYIDAHLGDRLDLCTLASVANFSPWHFHRLFRAATGETVGERVRRRRVETAAALLLAAPGTAVQVVALESGFGAPEVLSRSFKAHFGVTPSAWRGGACQRWAEARGPQLRARHPAPAAGPGIAVELRRLPARRVAYLRHVGPYGDPAIARLWQRFSTWTPLAGSTGGSRVLLGVGHESAEITPSHQCRYDACIEVADSFEPPPGLGLQRLPGGLFACSHFSGTGDAIVEAWLRLSAHCALELACRPDARPCIEIYGDTVAVAPDTGRFSCELCLPVRHR